MAAASPRYPGARPARLSPLFAAVGALVAGILTSPLLDGLPAAALLGATALCLLAVPALVRRPAWLAGALLLPVALFGCLRARDAATPPPGDVSRLAGGPSMWVGGTVESPPEPGSFGAWRYTLAVHSPASGRLYVTQRADAGPVPSVGEEVRVRGRVELPDSATNPGAFDFAAYLARRGVFATLTAKRTGDVERVADAADAPLSLAWAAGALRGALRASTARRLPAEDAALLDGLLLSARGRIPADLEDAFARTGTVHVLSTSGLHLTALAGLVLVALRWLPPRRPVRIAGALLGITLVWLYALAAGAGPAPTRAALMTTILLLGPALRRDADPLHSLALAAFVVLAHSPLALYDAGTQLSFATVGLLLLWVPPLERWLLPWEPGMTWGRRAARGVCLAVLAGAVAHLASAPLVAWHFGVLSWVAPVANLAVVPVSEALLLAGLGAASLDALLPSPADALLAPLWWGVRHLLGLLRGLALAFAAPSWAAVSVAPPPVWALALYYLILGGGAPVVRRRVLVQTLFAPKPWSRGRGEAS